MLPLPVWMTSVAKIRWPSESRVKSSSLLGPFLGLVMTTKTESRQPEERSALAEPKGIVVASPAVYSSEVAPALDFTTTLGPDCEIVRSSGVASMCATPGRTPDFLAGADGAMSLEVLGREIGRAHVWN